MWVQGRTANGMADVLAKQGLKKSQIYVLKPVCVVLYFVCIWYNPFVPTLFVSLVVGCYAIFVSPFNKILLCYQKKPQREQRL